MLTYNEALKILKEKNNKKYDDVKELLNEASKAYYNTSNIILSDTEYDQLANMLTDLDGTVIVGAKPESKEKGIISVSHKYKNLTGTLKKINNIEQFSEWYCDIIKKLKLKNLPNLLVTLKFDGNSIAIEYKNGKVVKALTRGQDEKGVDLTDVFKDDTINYKKPCGIKYEAIITDEHFKELCEKLNKDYANPRNVASGLLQSNNAKDFREYFTLVPLEMRIDNSIKSREDTINNDFELIFGDDCLFFNNAEIIDTEDKETNSKNIKDVVNTINEYYKRLDKERFDLPFLIDGIVIEILDEELRNELDYDPSGRPNYSVAMKFPYQEKVTTVTNIDFCYGSTGGRLTPRVWFKI